MSGVALGSHLFLIANICLATYAMAISLLNMSDAKYCLTGVGQALYAPLKKRTVKVQIILVKLGLVSMYFVHQLDPKSVSLAFFAAVMTFILVHNKPRAVRDIDDFKGNNDHLMKMYDRYLYSSLVVAVAIVGYFIYKAA